MELTTHAGEYIRLFADCIPVRGTRRSAIYDLTRRELHLFPTEYFPLLGWVSAAPVSRLIELLQHPEPSGTDGSPVERLEDFLDFLFDNQLVMFTADVARFPPINTAWDYPGEVQSAIIDVDTKVHDFGRLLLQLDALGCQFLQVRGFSPTLTLRLAADLVGFAENSSITSVELIVQYTSDMSDDLLVHFMRALPLVTSLTVHSAPQALRLPVRMAETEPGLTPERAVVLTPQVIDSETHCGLIAQAYFTPPTVPTFTELRHFNGCLNRKISVDASGNIRNCPSMRKSYGDAAKVSLREVTERADFQTSWTVTKDDIDVCRGCEFRYVCTDCRAYVETPSDPLSKPLKCGYDPATATWEPWYRPEFKAAVCSSYGIEIPSDPSREP